MQWKKLIINTLLNSIYNFKHCLGLQSQLENDPGPFPTPPYTPLLVYNNTMFNKIEKSEIKRKNPRITSVLISMYQNTSFKSVKYRILSNLPCGLSAERSYIQRKTQNNYFFSSIWSWRHTFFFKINKKYKFYKIY